MTDVPEKGDLGPGGSSVRPVYSERQMRCFLLTESEIQQIGFQSLLATVFTGVGSALIGLSVDLFKDLGTGEVSDPALRSVVGGVQLVTGVGGTICLLIAIWLWWQRRSFIKMIKRESAG